MNLDYVLKVFQFLIYKGERITCKDFANRIIETYDKNNNKIKEVFEFLNTLNLELYRSYF